MASIPWCTTPIAYINRLTVKKKGRSSKKKEERERKAIKQRDRRISTSSNSEREKSSVNREK
jgi:hypothetical protein